MGIFSKEKSFLEAEEDKQCIVDAIKKAEAHTLGEIRLFVEPTCAYVDAMDRARLIFNQLKMYETEARNAVLLYIAFKDRQVALFADEGICLQVASTYWDDLLQKMIVHFSKDQFVKGIVECIDSIGTKLKTLYPLNGQPNDNELPDAIVFGD